MGTKQVSCQIFVITIREGHHQFSWQKNQEQSRISPSVSMLVLTAAWRHGILGTTAAHRRRHSACGHAPARADVVRWKEHY
jgi:hypothetical protein